jgi:hypothetical protein
VYLRISFALVLLAAALVGTTFGQQTETKKSNDKKKQLAATTPKGTNAPATAESVAESAILIYGGLGGRKTLDQIRKTTIEHGKMSLVNAQGLSEPVNYVKWSVRGDNLD